jgi:hypothetical protein
LPEKARIGYLGEYAVAVRQAHGLEPAEGEFQVSGSAFQLQTLRRAALAQDWPQTSNLKPQTSNLPLYNILPLVIK